MECLVLNFVRTQGFLKVVFHGGMLVAIGKTADVFQRNQVIIFRYLFTQEIGKI